ncbi:disrupted in schizophrenia 1 protein-like [Nycticebus coucang]|uniref:disrupted in schizophrenia 1 protein-like n=1 Tax=Nycticebus coucang TaxID=9470 RepID=UPI00234D6012|nr:disrupted in schizophrenia 1 protein-like [Nycticebus coucang]
MKGKFGAKKQKTDDWHRETIRGLTVEGLIVVVIMMVIVEVLVVVSVVYSCKCLLLGKVWEADLEACRLLMQSLNLQEARGSLSAEDERQMNDLEEAVCTATLPFHPTPPSEDERKAPLQAFEDWKAHPTPFPHCAGGEQKEESHFLSAECGEKCEAIGKKLLHLEDQLHTAIHSHDEDLIHILFIVQIKHL